MIFYLSGRGDFALLITNAQEKHIVNLVDAKVGVIAQEVTFSLYSNKAKTDSRIPSTSYG